MSHLSVPDDCSELAGCEYTESGFLHRTEQLSTTQSMYMDTMHIYANACSAGRNSHSRNYGILHLRRVLSHLSVPA